ncbi:MAG: hypothetical protein EXR83_08885 [Gammaproteobacteria bacterium]|nr:hypothetical protein [Gammaproteobacteria bacterium]
MLKRIVLVLLLAAGTGAAYRHFAFGEWGWQPLHASEFSPDGCELYHAMLGLHQKPPTDAATAALVARCRPLAETHVWTRSQTGDALRFDRPSMVRMRLDVIDMNPEYHEDYPIIIVEFPYPPAPLEADGRWRPRGGPQTTMTAEQRQNLSRYWNPSWANLFAEWALGRGNHESWLGGATVGDGRHCASVEQDRDHPQKLCVMYLHNFKGEPVVVRFPLGRELEWRLEILELCRFGGRERRWQNPLAQAWFGRVEYTDTGCAPFVAPAPTQGS